MRALYHAMGIESLSSLNVWSLSYRFMQAISLYPATSFAPLAAARPAAAARLAKALAVAKESLAKKKAFIPGYATGFKSLLIAGPSYLVVLAIRATACFFSLFGKWGKGCAEKWRSKAQSIKLQYVIHNLCNLSAVRAPLPLLTFAKNIARCDAIRRKEDIKAADSMRASLLAQVHKQSPEIGALMKQQLEKAAFKGDDGTGICYGASLWFLKSFLGSRCATEDQLRRMVLPLGKGFPDEAAGVQMVFEKFAGLPKKDLLNWYRNQINGRLAELERQVDDVQHMEAFQAIYKHLADLIDNFDEVFSILQTGFKLGWMAGILGLKQHQDNWNLTRFYPFDSDSAVRKQFGELPLGAYQITFKTASSGHAIAYLKCAFGSYLFDPNFGLMKCAFPAADLQKLLKSYPLPRKSKGSERQLGVLRYELV